MNIRSFTKTKMDTLETELKEQEKNLKKIKKTTEKEMWLNDISELEKEL